MTDEVKLEPLYSPNKEKPMNLAIFMSGTGSNAKKIIERYIEDRGRGSVSFEPKLMFSDNPSSNAHKIAQETYKEKGVVVPFVLNPIREFYAKQGTDNLRDAGVREKYDKEQAKFLADYGIDAVALAGYDWVVTSIICENNLTINVHPGDLRVKDEKGKRKYTGLGWVPSAKSMLDGNTMFYTSVHLVTSELDGGPLAAISQPQYYAAHKGEENLFGEAKTLGDILKFIKANPEAKDDDITAKFSVYGHAKKVQELLKIWGDWVEFPQAIVNVALGNYQRDKEFRLHFKGKPIPNGI